MRSTILSALAACSLVLSSSPLQAAAQVQAPPEPVDELRGVWLTNVESKVLSSRGSIAKAMEFLERTNINVVFPVVWSQGYTLYPSEVAEREIGVKIHPRNQGRDVLQEVIDEAHSYGIAVVPWFEYGFAANYKDQGHNPLEKRPEWAALGRDGQPVEKNGFSWMNALHPEVQAFMTSLMLEVATKYDVEGVHGDDRLPALPVAAGYDPLTLAKWEQETGKPAPKDVLDPTWVKWRADLLTNYLRGFRSALAEAQPKVLFSSSPTPPGWGLTEVLQDSKSWLDQGLVDWLHPQAYARDAAGYEATMTKFLEGHYGTPASPRIYPGILIKSGNYSISDADLVRCIQWNRDHGIQGEILFFYEGLVQSKSLQKTLLSGPYARPAVLPRLPRFELKAPAAK